MSKQQRVFVDMDGTLAKFNKVEEIEQLFKKGYFENLEPQKNVVEAIKRLACDERFEVYILSSVLSDSQYALNEKNLWLDKYLLEIDLEHRLFPPCGTDKTLAVPGGLKETDILIDDYSVNLHNWEPPAKGLKLMNGINGSWGTWGGEKVHMMLSSTEIFKKIEEFSELKHRRLGRFTVSECDEFHNLGWVCENLSAEEAVDVYKECGNSPYGLGISVEDLDSDLSFSVFSCGHINNYIIDELNVGEELEPFCKMIQEKILKKGVEIKPMSEDEEIKEETEMEI